MAFLGSLSIGVSGGGGLQTGPWIFFLRQCQSNLVLAGVMAGRSESCGDIRGWRWDKRCTE